MTGAACGTCVKRQGSDQEVRMVEMIDFNGYEQNQRVYGGTAVTGDRCFSYWNQRDD